jgi:hypothetical protein
MSESIVQNAAMTVAGSIAGALVGGFLAPVVSTSAYAPAVMTEALGAAWLAKKGWNQNVGYGALAAAGVLAIGAIALNAAKKDLIAKQQATQGNLVGAVRMADIARMAPNSYLRLNGPEIHINERLVPLEGNLDVMVAGNIPAGTAQSAMWAANHGYVDQKMRALGIR